MKTRIATGLILLSAGVMVAGDRSGPKDAALSVYVPRSGVTARGETMLLGEICILRCSDPVLLGKAKGLQMGRAPWLGETLKINRKTIASRLATLGAAGRTAVISGADVVTVERKARKVSSKRILNAAQSFLETNRPGPRGCMWRLVREPASVVVPEGISAEFRARAADKPPAGCVKVIVDLLHKGKTVGSAEVLYRIVYRSQRAVASVDIPTGTVLTTENIKIMTAAAERPQRGWLPPYGKLTARRIAAGTVIDRRHARMPRPKIVIRRNQGVVMRIAGPTFVITAQGSALQDGRTGDYIKVRNVDSRKTVTAKVMFDGTVEPVYKGTR